MRKQQLNEVRKFQKIAGILKESATSEIEHEGEIYDMEKGIELPSAEMADRFRELGNQLGMKEAMPNMITGDYFFDYEPQDGAVASYGDVDPSHVVILNPKMQANEAVRQLVIDCISQ